MTPRHGDPDPAARRKRWGAYFDHARTERRLRNIDFARALGGTYDRSLISQWRHGKLVPSELGAMAIADALHLPAPDVLRAAGHDEMAARIEHLAARGIAPPPRDPVLEALDAIGDPDLTAPLAAEYERDLAAARRRLELELAELRRQITSPETGPGAGQDTA